MAGRGMGCAMRGGGAVESGPANKMISEPSKTTGVPMMKKGGIQHLMLQESFMVFGEILMLPSILINLTK